MKRSEQAERNSKSHCKLTLECACHFHRVSAAQGIPSSYADLIHCKCFADTQSHLLL